MENQISPLGWFLIILVVLLITSLYFSLFSKLKDKKQDQGWINSIQEAGKTLKDPFRSENSKMEELARSVENIQSQSGKLKNNNGDAEAGDLM